MSLVWLWSPVFPASPVPPLTHTAIKPSRGVWHPLMARPVSTAPPNLHSFSHDRSRKVSPMYLTTTVIVLPSGYKKAVVWVFGPPSSHWESTQKCSRQQFWACFRAQLTVSVNPLVVVGW